MSKSRFHSVETHPSASRSGNRRAAFARPRALGAAALTLLGASAWWVGAQNQNRVTPVRTAANSSASKSRLADLPRMVEEYGRSVAAAGGVTWPKGKTPPVAKTAGRPVSRAGFSLTERDLTPGNVSDERDPVFSPGGNLLAFSSNGADTNGDKRIDSLNANGKYHIWVMNRDGSNQRQVTGFGTVGAAQARDAERDQRQPSWSPDGTQLVYVDDVDGAASPDTQLFVATNVSATRPAIEQRTFFGGVKQHPSWSPSGLNIAFAANAAPNATVGTVNSFDIFTINPAGSVSQVVRLTGGTADPAGDGVDDVNPAFSLINQGVVLFASNRTNSSNNNARRIWLMNSDGSGKRQVSDPTLRPAGRPTDSDDMPGSSLTASQFISSFSERVAFQSNSLIDSSDGTPDLNVWSLSINTAGPGATPVPVVTPEPALNVNSYTAGQVRSYDVNNGTQTQGPVPGVFAGVADGQFEGIVYGPDVDGDGYEELYVANREKNTIERFNGATGAPFGANGGSTLVAAGASGLAKPTGLAYRFPYIYVGSGADAALTAGQTSGSTNTVKRFDARTGAPAGTNANFTIGGGITNGIEGVTFGPNGNLFVSALFDNKIVEFNGFNGTFVRDFVASGSGGLTLPTGLVFGPDNNLYVSSSGTDDVKRYRGPFGATQGAYIDDFVSDNNGATFGLDAPEGLVFDEDDNLYVSSFNSNGGNAATGDRVLRFALTPAGAPGTANPAAGQMGATFIADGGLQGPSYLTFNPAYYDRPTPTPSPTATATGTPVASPPVEQPSNTAILETNATSSPNGFANSKLSGPNAAEDRAADREAMFSRSNSSLQSATTIVFASQRRTAAAPGANSSNSDPTVVNPGGGNEGSAATHDIWITSAQDFTPPILVPQAAGNQLYPVVAPGPQAPFNAPRTVERGLSVNGPITVAVVIREQESGLRSVTATFTAAESPTYEGAPFSGTGEISGKDQPADTSRVNEDIPVRVRREAEPSVVQGRANMPLQLYDDGPPSVGGNERQAGAIRGDGIYYCTATLTTPGTAGDYYINISVADNAMQFGYDIVTQNVGQGNLFTYDNIWGFSTRAFSRSGQTSDLYVSDYGVGQRFPQYLSSSGFTGDPRFTYMDPIESYFLTNPGGDVVDPKTGLPAGVTVDTEKTTFRNVDVWRVLCRGDVPVDILNVYKPIPVQQFDPADFANGPNPSAEQRRVVGVAKSAIIWSSPYTAFVFSGPGTLYDAETQGRLSSFLNSGGRLFVTGRDVVYSLSNAGTQSNTFLRDELRANFADEYRGSSNVVTAAEGKFTQYEHPDLRKTNGDFNNLQFPPRTPPTGNGDSDKNKNTYADAATNQRLNFVNAAGLFGTDFINPVTDGATVTPAYTLDGKTVGQRIERTGRSGGINSRAVLLSFGFEGINRRYAKDPDVDGNPPFAANVRPAVGVGILRYLKTGGISGRVINDRTNLPIPNFFVEVSRNDIGKFIVKTDENGNFEFLGLPDEGFEIPNYATIRPISYVLRPAVDNRGDSINPGFFNTNGYGVGVSGSTTNSGNDLRVIPSPPGSLAGTAVTSNGTIDDPSDDTPLPNVPVLVRSLLESSIFPGGGRYAQLTTTDAGGRFSFSNVPSGTDVEVIFNPTVEDIPEESGLRTQYQADGGQNPNFRRRVISDARRPDTILIDAQGAPQRFDNIRVPVGETFTLNDGPNDVQENSGVAIVIPVGPSINGRVLLNGQGATAGRVLVELLNQAGVQLRTITATTQGAYSFFDVAPGTYIVRATKDFGGGYIITGQVSTTITTSSINTPDVQAPDIQLFKQDITGIVSLNGVALTGAKVELLTTSGALVSQPPLASPASVVTGADGRYQFLRVDPGSYIVRVTDTLNRVKSFPVTVKQFDGSTGGDVTLNIELFARAISGTVTLNGVPTRGIALELVQNDRVIATTTSGDNGAYSFTQLEPGDYIVRATITGDVTQIVVTLSTTGDFTNADLQLFTQTVSGRVTLNRVAASGATVQLLRNGTVVQETTTASNGTYSFSGVGAGDYIVRASFGGDSAETRIRIVRGADLSGIDLDLFLQNVSGRVTLNFKAIAGIDVELLQGDKVISTFKSDAAGGFNFAGVVGGDYVLRAAYKGDVVTLPITVVRGQDLSGLELQLFLQRITGQVLLGRDPLPGATIILSQGTRTVARTTTNSAGNYAFNEIPSGSYKVTANRYGDTVGRLVSVKRGENLVAPTLVILVHTASGTVTLNGKPIQGATVQILKDDVVIQRATTNVKGQYVLNTLSAGAYTVRATYQGDVAQKAINILRGASVRGVDLELRLQNASGRVLVNNVATGGIKVELLQGGVVKQRVETNSSGAYVFPSLLAGNYTVRATSASDTAQVNILVSRVGPVRVPDLKLRSQAVTGMVTLDGKATKGIIVQLLSDAFPTRRATTASDGRYSFGDVAEGRYTVRASMSIRGTTITAQTAIFVQKGVQESVPTLALRSPGPTPTPTQNPDDVDWEANTLTQISVPFTDSTDPYSTTTVQKAFTLPPSSNGVENYRLYTYDPVQMKDVQLSAGSILRRGQGYFIQTLARGVALRRPEFDATRKATPVTEFEITLRLNRSAPLGSRTNGYNLIGFPFDPAKFSRANWLAARVITPSGRTYATLQEAVADGVLSANLSTYDPQLGQYSPLPTTILEPYQGYYARTFVDGVRVILRAAE
jgi:hypothetical protein